MKRDNSLSKRLLDSVSEESKRKVEKAMTCKWLRNSNECGKGLPGTPCEVVGCVAWEYYKEDKK